MTDTIILALLAFPIILTVANIASVTIILTLHEETFKRIIKQALVEAYIENRAR